MSYEGEILLSCPSDIDFTNTWAVVVSGAKWNPCGHMLLCCGTSSANSWYLHVAGQGLREAGGIRAYPKFMRGDVNFYRYLTENNKSEIRRLSAELSDPNAAYNKLISFMMNKWNWAVLINNCATFTREIIEAGGGKVDVVLNCPDRETSKKVEAAADAAARGIIEASKYGFGPM